MSSYPPQVAVDVNAIAKLSKEPHLELGWSGRLWEPGGFFRDVNGKFRFSAKLWILMNLSLVIGQYFFWLYGTRLSSDAVNAVIYQLIFFTTSTNLITWFVSLAAWKIARDGNEGLKRFEHDFNLRGKELGLTLVDLNDIGKAIHQTGLTKDEVHDFIMLMREMTSKLKADGWTVEGVRAGLNQLDNLTGRVRQQSAEMDTVLRNARSTITQIDSAAKGLAATYARIEQKVDDAIRKIEAASIARQHAPLAAPNEVNSP